MPIEIVQFDQDDFLQTWLQQMPNLDQPDQTGDQPDQTGSMNAKSVVILVFGCLAALAGGWSRLCRFERSRSEELRTSGCFWASC